MMKTALMHSTHTYIHIYIHINNQPTISSYMFSDKNKFVKKIITNIYHKSKSRLLSLVIQKAACCMSLKQNITKKAFKTPIPLIKSTLKKITKNAQRIPEILFFLCPF